jgi:signal transduction histidine kinase/predicted ester cyclase
MYKDVNMKQILVLLFIFLIPFHSFGINPDGLINHWIFDATHISGNIIHDQAGTVDAEIEGPVIFDDRTSQKRLILNWLTDPIKIQKEFPASLLPQKELTIEAWFYPIAGSYQIIECKSGDDSTPIFSLDCNFHYFSFTLSSDGLQNQESSSFTIPSINIIEQNQWYHVVGTYDGLAQKIYVNGICENISTLPSGKLRYYTQPSYQIGNNKATNRVMQCSLHDIKIYNRSLSRFEVLQNYIHQSKTIGSSPSQSFTTTDRAIQLPQAPMNWQYWSAKDGLGESMVTAMNIGPTGNLCLSHSETGDHFSFLDGYQVHPIPSWKSPRIHIYEEPEHVFWAIHKSDIATYHFNYDDSTQAWIEYPIHPPAYEGIQSWVPMTVNSTAKKIMHPLSATQALYISNDQKLILFDRTTKICDLVLSVTDTNLGTFRHLFVDQHNTIWIAGKFGLLKLPHPFDWEEYLLDSSLGIYNLYFYYETLHGNFVFYASQPEGYIKVLFNGSTFQIMKLMASQRPPFDIYPEDIDILDHECGIWLREIYPFILREKGQDYSTDKEKQFAALSNSWLFGVKTQNETLWFEFMQGLVRATPELWRIPSELSEYHHLTREGAAANGICEDLHGNIWVCYRSMLAEYDGSKWILHPYPKGLGTFMYLCGLGTLKNGHIYFGNLAFYDPIEKTYKVATHQDGYQLGQVIRQNQTNTNSIWIKHNNTIGLYDGECYKSRIEFNGNDIDKIYDILQTENGELWLATNKGVLRYRHGLLIPFEEKNQPTINCASALCKLDETTLWIGGNNSIYQYDGNTWSIIQNKIDRVNRIRKFRDGSIWVATFSGIHRFHRGVRLTYTMDDGLSSDNVWDVFEDSQGRIWAATYFGLNQFTPEHDRPIVVLDSANPEKILSEGDVQLKFIGIDKWNVTPPENLQYSYRLNQGDWSVFSTNTVASFKGLPPGEHQFQVRVMDRGMNISDVVHWDFTVIPSIYHDPVFWILFGVSFIVITLLLGLHISNYLNLANLVTDRTKHLITYQDKLKSLASSLSLSEEREKRKLAAELHDRIGHGLASCKMLITSLQKQVHNSAVQENLNQTKEMMTQLIEDTRTMTFEISPPILYVLGLKPALDWLGEQIQKHHNIHVEINDDGKEKPLSEDALGFVYRAVRELLFNVVKHAKATSVAVSLRCDQEVLTILVEDDGIGFDTSTLDSQISDEKSFGLFSLRERVEHLGGSFNHDSIQNQGTQISLTLPFSVYSHDKQKPFPEVLLNNRKEFTWTHSSKRNIDQGFSETNKKLVTRFIEKVWNQKELDVADEVLTSNIVSHIVPQDVHGPEDYKQLVLTFLVGFPDFRIHIDELVAEHDKVVVRLTYTGTHKGEFMGVAPTEHNVTYTGTCIYRITDGHIAEEWNSTDFLGLMQQISEIPIS